MRKLNNNSLGLVFGLLSAVLWGSYGTFLKLMGEAGIKEMTIAAMSPTIVVLFFLIKILAKRPKNLLIEGHLLVMVAIHGIIITSGINFCYVKAVSAIPVGIVSIISFLHVIILMITTRIVFGYSITTKKVAMALISLVGLVFVLEIFKVSGSLSFSGVMWAAFEALLVAIGSTLLKYYLTKGVESTTVFFYTNLFAAVTLWCSTPPWRIIGEVIQTASVNGYEVWLIILGFALFPLIGSFVFFGKAYELIEPTFVSIMFSVDSVIATLLGFLILSQNLSIAQIFGMIIILIPVAYIQYIEGKDPGEGKVIVDIPKSVEV